MQCKHPIEHGRCSNGHQQLQLEALHLVKYVCESFYRVVSEVKTYCP